MDSLPLEPPGKKTQREQQLRGKVLGNFWNCGKAGVTTAQRGWEVVRGSLETGRSKMCEGFEASIMDFIHEL